MISMFRNFVRTVGIVLKRCTRRMLSFYCSVKYQREYWSEHKVACSLIVAHRKTGKCNYVNSWRKAFHSFASSVFYSTECNKLILTIELCALMEVFNVYLQLCWTCLILPRLVLYCELLALHGIVLITFSIILISYTFKMVTLYRVDFLNKTRQYV